MLSTYYSEYAVAAVFVFVALSIPMGMLTVSLLGSFVRMRPQRSSKVKSEPYESGVIAINPKPRLFRFHYYYYAILFVTLDVETVLLYPVAVNYGVFSAQFGATALVALLVFLVVVTLPFVHAWRKGVLEWR